MAPGEKHTVTKTGTTTTMTTPSTRGPGLSPRDSDRIEEVVASLREQNGVDASVLIGDLNVDDGGFRDGALRLHAALGPRAGSAVLLVVAPGQRRVEIVTGPTISRRVPDRVCALAVLSMTTSFVGSDIAAGVIDGLRQIADAAGRAPALPAPGTSGALAVSTAHSEPPTTPALGEPDPHGIDEAREPENH